MSAPVFHILRPAERAVAGSLAIAFAAVCGYLVFVSFSDATALQRAAGPEGSQLGDRGRDLVFANTGRAWRDRALARQAATAAPRLARAEAPVDPLPLRKDVP